MRNARRVIAACLSLLMIGLTACNGDDTVTTVATTTTTVTTESTTAEWQSTTTVQGETTSTTDTTVPASSVDGTTAGKTTVIKTDAVTTTVKNQDAWVGITKKTTTKKTAATTTTVAYNNTLKQVQRDSKYTNEFSIYHTLKGYMNESVIKSSTWLPILGYTKDGEIVDAMYTSIAVMPGPLQVYHSSEFATKEKWDAWRQHSYDNLESINEAAKVVQDALQLKEHKIKIFLTLVTPDESLHKNWGTLNGAKMSVKNKEEKFRMIKYMIDSYIAEMKEKTYSNIDFVGFYFMDEHLLDKDMDWYTRVNEYIHSQGKIIMISPFYKAGGWTRCEDVGFDLHSMQSNYYPLGTVGAVNCGTYRRVPATADLINSGQIGGMELELGDHTKYDAVTGLKMMLKVGVESGIVNGYHVHYFGSGGLAVYVMGRSRDEYFRSCYDELYKYMNNTLTADEIRIKPLETEQKWADGAIDWI